MARKPDSSRPAEAAGTQPGPSGPRWLLARLLPGRSASERFGFAVAWFVLIAIGAQVVATVADNVSHDWWSAWDTNAYWLAARHLIEGSPLYAPADIWTGGAYKYPPLYAQLWLPIGFAPEVPVDWAWRMVGFLCLRYLAGSWKLTVLATLQWPVMAELGFGNVTLQLGAVLMACFGRGRVATAGMLLLPWTAGLKVGPAFLIVYLWLTRPAARRTLAVGCAIFAAACAGSFALSPGQWFDYLGTFGWEAASQMQALHVLAIVPQSGGLDFAVRLAIALVAILAALRWRLDWLAFTVAATTMPIFSLTRLAILVGLWPLWLRDVVARWRAGGSVAAEWLTAPLVHLDMLPRAEGEPGAAAETPRAA